jgi:hypothetical protein
MAVFTKTYVQCDLCEAQRELSSSGDGWYRVETNVNKLAAGNVAGEKVFSRASDVCSTCFTAIQEGEFSNLFLPERAPSAPRPMVKPVTPA